LQQKNKGGERKGESIRKKLLKKNGEEKNGEGRIKVPYRPCMGGREEIAYISP